MASVACLVCACAEEKAEVRVENEPCVDRCEDNVMKYCNGSKSDCSFGCNAEGNGCATQASSCTPGCKNGIFTKCKGGAAEIVNCPTGQCNAAGTACGEQQSDVCKPSCSNNVATVCNGGVASTQQCTYGCRGSACATSPKCTPSCKDGVATLCDGDVPTTKQCPNGCNATNDGCLIGGGGECEQATKCNGNILHVCDVAAGFTREFDYNCADYQQTCTTVDSVDDCRNTCTTAGDTKKQCNQGTFTGSYTINYVCKKGSDNTLYWDRDNNSEKPCNSGEACNSDFTECATAETCQISNYIAQCDNGIAKTCTESGTIQLANCTLKGQTCAEVSNSSAICVDNDMVCTTPGTKKYKCGVNNEIEQKPVSIPHTCKDTNDGKKFYLDDGAREACGNYGCDNTTGLCIFESSEEGKSCTTSYKQHCETTQNGYELALYCSKEDALSSSRVMSVKCTDPGEFCMVVQTTQSGNMSDSDGNVADCFTTSSNCTQGETKTTSDSTHTYLMECGLGSDGRLYWVDVNYTDK